MNRTKAKLVLDGITHAFTDGEKERTILDGLSLEVGEGELVAVTGPSGSGKSTFLSIAGRCCRRTAARCASTGSRCPAWTRCGSRSCVSASSASSFNRRT